MIGELAHSLSYEFFPTSEQITEWLGDTAFVVAKQGLGDGYRQRLVVSED